MVRIFVRSALILYVAAWPSFLKIAHSSLAHYGKICKIRFAFVMDRLTLSLVIPKDYARTLN